MGVALAAAAVGCRMGPDPSRPTNVTEAGRPFANADQPQPISPPPEVSRWWERFDDPVTERLVDRAVEHNQNLRQAAARLLAARAELGAATGRRLPSVDLGIARDRSRRLFTGFGAALDAPAIRTTTWSTSLSTSWQVDLFGKLYRGQEQALAEMLATEADREALLHSVVADVVRTRATIATLQRQLDLARANVASWRRSYEITQRRYDQGVATALELRLSRENLATTQAQVPEIEFQLRRAMHALDVLVGRQPAQQPIPEDTLSELPPLPNPPVGIPAHLLDRRPDLRASAFRHAAETLGIGVAIADMLPDFSISASTGHEGDGFEDVFEHPSSWVWTLVTQATVKLFRGGALRANVDAARARTEAAAAAYAQTVLEAIREVEDALVRERTARRRYEFVRTRVHEATEATRLARERYERGVETLLSVLEAERRKRAAEDQLIATQQSIWTARVDLYLAIGGDWAVQPPMMTVDELEAAQGSGIAPRWPLGLREDAAGQQPEPAVEVGSDPETPQQHEQ